MFVLKSVPKNVKGIEQKLVNVETNYFENTGEKIHRMDGRFEAFDSSSRR